MRWVAVLILLEFGTAAQSADAPDFNREVRPILAARCFKCHGPDDRARKAKLRLDTREGAEKALGNLGESELIRRIGSSDPDAVMPPPSVKAPLTTRQKETLNAWVTAGANYSPHWSFLRQSDRPSPKPEVAVSNPIDAFIRARLDREGLKSIARSGPLHSHPARLPRPHRYPADAGRSCGLY